MGGAHRNRGAMAETIKNALINTLGDLQGLPPETLLERRRQRLLGYGQFKEG